MTTPARPRRNRATRSYHRTGAYPVSWALPFLVERVKDPSVADDALTPVERGARAWRGEVLHDLGGPEAVSAAKLALVEAALGTKIVLDSLDRYLFELASIDGLANRRNRGTQLPETGALRLGQQKQKVAIVPPITLLKESNTRTGFFERPLFEAVRSFLPEELRGLVTFMYLTGWRLGNVLRLPWSQVDFHAGVVRLEPGTTKNDDGVEFPFSVLPELETVLRTQWEMTKAVGLPSERPADPLLPSIVGSGLLPGWRGPA